MTDAPFVPGTPKVDLKECVLDVRAEMMAVELVFEALAPIDGAATLIDAVAPGYRAVIIQDDGHHAMFRALLHLREAVETLTRNTVGRPG